MQNYMELSTVADILRERKIMPDDDFTAAAGQDYGYVAAWGLPDGNYLIAYGNNGETNYAIADDADDLARWLEPPDLSDLDEILHTANLYGMTDEASPKEACPDDQGPFVIIRMRHYYGPVDKGNYIADESSGSAREFDSYKEAKAWIEEEEGVYCTAHNESGAPTYHIVSTQTYRDRPCATPSSPRPRA